MSQFEPSIFHLFDNLPPRAIRTWLKLYAKVADYASDHFSFFARRRSQVYEQLECSLLLNTKPFEFKGWRRVVDHQFSNTPLSAKGSVLHFPGGRFNVGDIDTTRFPTFPALYLAEDAPTAYREMLSLDPNDKIDGLTAKELNAAGNVAQFVVKGSLGTVLDLTDAEILRDFFEAIKSIILPTEFTRRAAQIKIPSMRPVKSLKELRETLFRDDWRLMPMQFDVPANSQVLGQIAYNAGIEGIIFPSGKTKKRNIAIYPENFKSTDSFVEIVGEVAGSVEGKRIDKRSYKKYI